VPGQGVTVGRGSKGFTLVEVVVSAVLLALAIAGSYLVVSRTAWLVRTARNHYVAVSIGRARIERARGFAYEDLWLLRETNVVVDVRGVPSSDGDFRRTTLVNTNAQPNLTLVTVDVEIRNVRTGRFTGEKESVACYFTEYLTP